jgi:ssDNA thymidine ADP-ribosyltransferase DarT-like protein
VSNNLNAKKALIFRIVHRANVAWLLDHGVHCGSSQTRDPKYVAIGNAELIAKRTSRSIDVSPHGTLDDYVPFYFTPYSPMLLNIKTGYNGITRRANEEIVILVSSLHRLKELKVPFVFSDRHAFLKTARFSSALDELDRIDWKILQQRDFKRDLNDLQKMDRYQAEALVHKRMPVEALLGVACYDQATGAQLEATIKRRHIDLRVLVQPSWYF